VKCLPWAAVLQQQSAPAWVPHGVMSPASNPAPVWAPLSMGPQVLPGACSSLGFPRGLSLLWASSYSSVGSSLGCRWGSAPPWTSMGYTWRSGPPWTSTGCRAQPASPGSAPWLQVNLCSGAWSTSCSSFTDLGVCRAVPLASSHSSLLLQLPLYRGGSPLFNCVIPEALPPLLMG